MHVLAGGGRSLPVNTHRVHRHWVAMLPQQRNLCSRSSFTGTVLNLQMEHIYLGHPPLLWGLVIVVQCHTEPQWSYKVAEVVKAGRARPSTHPHGESDSWIHSIVSLPSFSEKMSSPHQLLTLGGFCFPLPLFRVNSPTYQLLTARRFLLSLPLFGVNFCPLSLLPIYPSAHASLRFNSTAFVLHHRATPTMPPSWERGKEGRGAEQRKIYSSI